MIVSILLKIDGAVGYVSKQKAYTTLPVRRLTNWRYICLWGKEVDVPSCTN